MSESLGDHPQVPDLGKEKDSTNRTVVPIFASHDVFGLLIAIKFAGVRRQLQRGELPLTYSGWSNATFTDIQTINPSVIAFDGLTAVRSSVGLFENPGKPFALQKSTEQKPLFIIGADMMQVSEIPEVLELNGETKTEFVITVLQEYAKKHMPHLMEQKRHGPMDLDEPTYKALNFRNALMAAKALDVYASLGEKVADGPIASVLGFGHGFTRDNVWEDR